MVIALSFPPKDQEGYVPNTIVDEEYPTIVHEFVPRDPDTVPDIPFPNDGVTRDFTHFDIDPRNSKFEPEGIIRLVEVGWGLIRRQSWCTITTMPISFTGSCRCSRSVLRDKLILLFVQVLTWLLGSLAISASPKIWSRVIHAGKGKTVIDIAIDKTEAGMLTRHQQGRSAG
jgi:hypothetical protein